MRHDLTCLACGSDRDVLMRMVEVPEGARREVTVLLDAAISPTPTPLTVPERFIREPRCRDERACADRVKALEETA